MAEGYFLTPEDRALLNQVADWWRYVRHYQSINLAGRRRIMPLAAKECRGLLKGILNQSATSATVDNIAALTGASPTTSSTGTITTSNRYLLGGPDNAPCRISLSCLSTSTRWELDYVSAATMCRAVAKGVISGSTGTVDGVTPMNSGMSPTAGSTSTLAVKNPWNFYLADNALCTIARNSSVWDLTEAPMVAETLETEERVNALTFQGKHRTIRANFSTTESTWTTWHTGNICT